MERNFGAWISGFSYPDLWAKLGADASVLSMICPLCLSSKARELEAIPTADLTSEYRRQLNVPVAAEFATVAGHIHLFGCGGCELEFFDPPIAGSPQFYADVCEIDGYYPEDRWEFARVAERIPIDAEVLDVGCGDAEFLKGLPNKNKRGLEHNPRSLAKTKDLGFPVRAESLAKQSAESADVVTLFQVLEHLSRPVEILDDLLRVLRPGGLLAIAVPNNDGYVGRAIHSPLNAPPHHVLRWGEKSLRWIAGAYPLKLEGIEFEPVWQEHLFQYRRTILSHRIARSFGYHPSLYALDLRTILCRKVATALSYGWCWLNATLPLDEHGHSIVAYYRKEE